MRNPQTKLLKDMPKAYGGDLLKKRKARQSGRPIVTKNTMHLVLRSTQAVGDWSFSKKANKTIIAEVITKFSKLYSVRILSMANVGNHLHFQIQLASRHTYKKFIKAITSVIVTRITGASRLKTKLKKHFWDYRPYTRVVIGYNARLTLEHYIEINQLEGQGYSRPDAIDLIKNDHNTR